MRRVLRLVGIVTVLLTAACGSTVRPSARPVASADRLSASRGRGVADATVGTGDATSGATDSGSPAGVAAAGAPQRTVHGAVGPVAAGVPASGKGWDAKFVYIGVTTQKDAQSIYERFGFKGVDPGDTEAQANAVADDINRHGGVLGRKVKLVFRDLASIDTATHPDAAGNATCTYFSQDRPVVAVVNMLTVMDVPSWRACMAKAKIALFSSTSESIDDGEARQLAPYFYQLVGVSWDPLAPVMVNVLKQQGWFGGWDVHLGQPEPAVKPKFGILSLDTPGGTRQANVIKKALVAAGYPDVLTYQYEFPGNQIQPAVLYFNGNGVTHIISTDIELFAFQQNATSQRYHPRYGINTYNAPQNNLEQFSPAGQNNGAIGVGWAPTFDVSQANDPGDSVGARACKAMEAAANVRNPGRLATAFNDALCDGLLAAAKGAVAGNGFTGAAMYNGIMRIAPTFTSALGFSTGLTPTKLFVPGSVRPLLFVADCSCFRYGAGEAKL